MWLAPSVCSNAGPCRLFIEWLVSAAEGLTCYNPPSTTLYRLPVELSRKQMHFLGFVKHWLSTHKTCVQGWMFVFLKSWYSGHMVPSFVFIDNYFLVVAILSFLNCFFFFLKD